VSERAARAYLLWGDDTPSRDELVRGFRTRMLARPGGALNLSEFQAPSLSAAEVIAACDTVPFLDDRRLVIVHQLFGWRARQAGRRRAEAEARSDSSGLKAEREQLLAYLPRLAPQTTLVLVEPQLAPPVLAEISRALPADRRDVRAFGAPRGAELERWLAVRARRRNGALAPGVARLLRQHGPASLEALDQEVAKLVTYAAGEPVSVADLNELLAGSEIVVFELLDALAEGRQGDALAAYRRLLRQGGRAEELTPQIIALYRRLLICRLALEERASLAEVQAAHGVKLIDKLQGQARGWTSEALRRSLGLLLALDRRLKRGETEAESGLEVAIDQLAGLQRNGARTSA
jgi:DNA polymerase-3 subunit delta